MKRYITKITWLLALLPLLLSCNEEERFSPEPPLANGEAVLKFRFEFPKKKSATYAPGDYSETFDSEKEIKSIAFFTQNKDEGSGIDFKAGAFNRFLSTEELRTATGLHEPLDGGNGAYTTTIKIRSDGFGDNEVQVLIIANYAENGLTQTLKNITSWSQLANLTTQQLSNNPETPLLMVAHDDNVPLINGGTSNITFKLERLVSRIDIENKATTSGFEITSAQLVNPREKSYITINPGSDNIALASTDFDPVLANNGPTPDPARIVGVYTYENKNDNPAKATAVLVKGTFNGIQFEKKIALKHPDKDGVTGDPIPLQRNFRYAINITPSATPTDVEWTIKVANWDDGEEVQVNPPTDSIPKLSNFEFNGNAIDAQWYPDALAYNMDDRASTKISFTVTNINTTKYSISYKCLPRHAAAFDMYNKNSSAYQNFVKRDNPVITYAQIEQRYEITIPPLLNEPIAPVVIVLSIENAHDRNHKQDIVFFYNKSNYPGTNYPPVLVGGKYWAPINVGATLLDPNVMSPATTGGAYQWGRNMGFSSLWGIDGAPVSAPTIQTGPVEYNECETTTGIYRNAFITAPGTDYDWLKKTDMDKWNYRNKRWSPKVNDSPCPNGWRLPTNAEIQLIIDRYSADKSIGWNHFVIGDKGDRLYFPRGGYRPFANGMFSDVINNRGLFWSSDYYIDNSSGKIYGHSLDFGFNESSKWSKNNTHPISYGWHIRCVQQDEEDGRS